MDNKQAAQKVVRNYTINTSYMHPTSPLSLSHTRQFIIADTYARYLKILGYKIANPIIFHYSGRTAEDIIRSIKIYFTKGKITPEGSEVWVLKNVYRIPDRILETMDEPIKLLNYFANEQLQHLRKLGIFADSNSTYNTKLENYEDFVRQIYRRYNDLGLLCETLEKNSMRYNDPEWLSKVIAQFEETQFIGKNIRPTILAALNFLASIKEGWLFERDNGTGVNINGKIIEPMSDSELISMFDSIKNNLQLPLDLFFVEEHLKIWIAKKIYAEVAILPREERTKAYFIIGRVKSIKVDYGNNVIYKIKLPYLLDRYDPIIIRLAMLICAEPGNDFRWNNDILKSATRLLKKYLKFENYEDTFPKGENAEADEIVSSGLNAISYYMAKGLFRHAILEALPYVLEKLKKINLSNGRGLLIDKYDKAISYLFVLNDKQLTQTKIIPYLYLNGKHHEL
ncbi:hypothetical protein M1141_01320 [Candidatus Marsarchaeota archaeon]|nr:hypothetical protein [Candidatus Marsarchaeota archaeon]